MVRVSLLFIFLLFGGHVIAHGGGLDSNGGH